MSHRTLELVVVVALAAALVSASATVPVPVPAVGPAGAGEPPVAPDLSDPDDVESWLDAEMADQLERYHVPGAVVVVVRDGEPLVSKGYGYADVESETPVVANETVFSIGSTGKLLTWTAVMQGVEDGRLELDRDVNDYLVDSPVEVPDTYPEPVTLEHLGTHSAGFEDSFAGMLADDPSEVRPLGDLLAENRPARVRPPGEFVAYSNYGTALAGHVVAERYDTTFTDHVDERLLGPLGMADTTYDQPLPERLRARAAVGYTYEGGEYRPHDPLVWTMPPEGGSLKSTGTDMGRFMLAHLNEGAYGDERILEAETVREMHRRHFTKAPDAPDLNGMAYGFIEMDQNGERIVGHWGDTAYFRSLLALYPERGTGLFVAYNSPGGHDARFELLDAFTDRYFPRSDSPVVAPPDGAAERATGLAGEYRSLTISETTWHRILGVATRTVTVEATADGFLTTRRLGGDPTTWVERRPGVYEAVGDDAMLVFRFDESGRATHLFFGDFGPATYERVPWTETLTAVQTVIGGGVVAFLSALVLWAGEAVWRRRRGRTPPGGGERRKRVARWLLGVTGVLWVVTIAAFVLAWLNFNAEVASPSLVLRAGQVLRYVALAGTVGSVVATAVAWRDGYWTLPHRLHYAAVTLVAVLVAWQLYSLRVLVF